LPLSDSPEATSAQWEMTTMMLQRRETAFTLTILVLPEITVLWALSTLMTLKDVHYFLCVMPCSSFGWCLWFTGDFGEVSTVKSSPQNIRLNVVAGLELELQVCSTRTRYPP